MMPSSIFKRFLCSTVAAVGLCGALASAAQAETIVSVTQVHYDAAGRPDCTAVRMNVATFGSLPASACTLATTGSFGADRITHNVYDNAGQVVQVDQAYGVSADQRMYARYTYTNNGLRQTEMDANGNKTMYVYDGFDRVSQVQYPSTTIGSGGVNTADYEQYGYDANGNKTSWRRRDGQTIGFTYDNLNRETIKDIPGGTASDVYTSYDLLGHIINRLFASTSGSGVSYTYNALGSQATATDYNGRTISFAYNQAMARTVMWYPDSNTIGYTRDAANRMTAIGYNAYSGMFSQNYDDLGRLYSQGKAGGTSTFVTDSVGRLSSVTNDLNGTSYDVTWTFNYNPAGQISSTSATSTTYDYKETTSSTVNQTYDGLNRDAAIAAVSGGYDSRGNITYDGTRTFTYDIENRMLTAISATANVKLIYDPEGRLSRYPTDGGASYSTFLYDGVNLIAEYDAGGNVAERYVHGGGTDNPVVWLHGPSTTDMRWFYTDYHGSIIAYTDNAGNIVNYYKYGPYGEPKNASDVTSFSGPRFRYTGQTAIPEAGLYYYKARIYDPIAGRFLQTDPIGSKDDLDLYAYTAGDPVNGSDSTGLESECIPCDVAERAVVGMATGYATGALAEAAVETLEQKPLDMTSINNAGVGGLVQGGIVGAIDPGSKPLQAGVGAVAAVAGTVVTNSLNNKPTTAGDVVVATIAGAAGGIAGPALANRAANAAGTAQVKAVVNAAAKGNENAMVQLGGSLKYTSDKAGTAIKTGVAKATSAIADAATSFMQNILSQDKSNDKKNQRY